MDIIRHNFQLDDCLDWITANNFKRVVLQLKREALKHSVSITKYLKETYKARTNEQGLDLYVTQANTCCIDLMITQHVTNVEAIIHFGKVCLSKPEIQNSPSEIPILFVFGTVQPESVTFQETLHRLTNEIESTCKSEPNCMIVILYDTDLIDYADQVEQALRHPNLTDKIEVANLYCPSPSWSTTRSNQHRFIKDSNHNTDRIFGQYLLNKSIDRYNCAIYLGDRLSIQLTLQCPSKLFKVDLNNFQFERVSVRRVLNKRMALVGRLKDEEELKIGVIITNPLPDISKVMETLEFYSKARKHTLYFISMIQTIDECKIGNFDSSDAFIVINSCSCSTILESLVFNRPILNDLEFKLACGFEAEYGRVLWPGSSSHLTEDDMINKRKVSDVSLALIHTRNELLERCSLARANKWSGLEYKATVGNDDKGGGGGESLVVEDGLSGIASSYASEPLKKSDIVSRNNETEQGNIGSVKAAESDISDVVYPNKGE